MRKLLLVFGAGALGGLVSSLLVWQFGYMGVNRALGVAIAPDLTLNWLYPRIVWGGLWGFLFILPILRSRLLAQSLVFALFPALAQLFIFYPYHTNAGIAGLNLGMLTPVLVFFFSWIWALSTAVALRLSR
jgi:hypothetical protein